MIEHKEDVEKLKNHKDDLEKALEAKTTDVQKNLSSSLSKVEEEMKRHFSH